MILQKVKVSELSGPALDWAVLVAEGWESDRPQDGQLRRKISKVKYDVCIVGPRLMRYDQHLGRHWRSPSTDWSQGGPLIDKYAVKVEHFPGETIASKANARVAMNRTAYWQSGPTPLVALCRAIVAANLGDVVSVPEELVQQQGEGGCP